MSAGELFGKVHLGYPAKYHCGSNDPVTGHVALTYRPPSNGKSSSNPEDLQSLFGPLKVFLTFKGRAKSKIHKSNGQTSSTYRGRAPLFEEHVKIFDGTLTSKAAECTRFPFSLNFPDASQPMPNQGDFRRDNRFHEEHGGPLPPTFSTKFRGFSKSTVAFVEYRVCALVRMPGIDINIRGLEGENNEPAVLYEQPRLPASEAPPTPVQQFSHTIELQNENLLPESERPTGFRQKTKFLFSSEQYPTYIFDIITSLPAEVYMGQPLKFELSLHPNWNRCTAPLPPEVKLQSFRVCMESHTDIRAEYGFLSAPESSSTDITCPLITMTIEKDTPFCKANDHTKIVHTRAGILNARSSFSTYNICRHYTLRIEYVIFAAGKTKTLKRTVPVTVHPPLDDGREMLSTEGSSNTPAVAEASSSSSTAAVSASQDSKAQPPASEPAESSAALPQYERPPEYDDVLEMRTEDDVPEGRISEDTKTGKGKAVMT